MLVAIPTDISAQYADGSTRWNSTYTLLILFGVAVVNRIVGLLSGATRMGNKTCITYLLAPPISHNNPLQIEQQNKTVTMLVERGL